MICDPVQFFYIFLPSIFSILLSENTKIGNWQFRLSLFILLNALSIVDTTKYGTF